MSDRLAGKIALVTGAASGIGAATAGLFAAEGAHVVIADVNEVGAKAVATGIRESGGAADALYLDVGDEGAVTEALNQLAEEHGQLDVVVNCAFRMVAGTLDALSTEDWQRCLAVTLHGTFFSLRASLGIMKRQGGGAIVNVSSLCGQRGQSSMGGYGASKGAVENLTRTAAVEAAAHGVRVNAVAPGCVATPGTLEVFPAGSADRAAMEALMPSERLLEPIEVAHAILFLASDDASGVNGQILNVDSGQSTALGTPDLDEGWDR